MENKGSISVHTWLGDGMSSSDILQTILNGKKKKKESKGVYLCSYKNCHTIGFASIPLIIWMKLPGKHEIRVDRTKTVNEEFPCPFCKWMEELATWMQALP